MEIKIERQTVMILGMFILVPIGFIILLALLTSTPTGSVGGSPREVNVDSEVAISVGAGGFSPRSIEIPAGKDVLLKIDNVGASGCTNSIISRSLFKGTLSLGQKGDQVEQVIRADAPGDYTITCWMGMVSMNVKAI